MPHPQGASFTSCTAETLSSRNSSSQAPPATAPGNCPYSLSPGTSPLWATQAAGTVPHVSLCGWLTALSTLCAGAAMRQASAPAASTRLIVRGLDRARAHGVIVMHPAGSPGTSRFTPPPSCLLVLPPLVVLLNHCVTSAVDFRASHPPLACFCCRNSGQETAWTSLNLTALLP